MSNVTHTPALVSSCAQAATVKEAAFRIDYPLAAARNTRVVALDDEALEVVRSVAGHEWSQARFYSTTDPGRELITVAGEVAGLVDEIENSNTVVLVSSNGENAEAAATIGSACAVRGIMTAGLVLTPGLVTSESLWTLRPYARILLVPADHDDLLELLRATRA